MWRSRAVFSKQTPRFSLLLEPVLKAQDSIYSTNRTDDWGYRHHKVTLGQVLTQDWAGDKKPVGYVSELLEPMSRGWPTCLQAIVAVALLVEEAKKITFGALLIVYTPHSMRTILQQKADKWLTDARLLKYEAILIHVPELELRTTTAKNPAEFLFGEASEGLTHNCAEIIELQTKIRADLDEEELEEGEKWFVDRSA
ncbi:hypothetical protein DUI87_02280 [Hirundo rustica rustica]|uniref:Reverse transcriptase RNase H-like domain-containing protein n=1 Tax=Hirundo rustica rustica TaxID=333673 RepID=A0A3M0L7U8_HIRRU|nr:hypothetical protein DUI87_02280 [Hirundo rustica rustica]